jgi:hypothetical protein
VARVDWPHRGAGDWLVCTYPDGPENVGFLELVHAT